MDAREVVIKGVLRKAMKKGANGIHVVAEKKKKGTNAFGFGGVQLHITAEAFKLVEPTIPNIRESIHNQVNKTQVIVRNNMNLILQNRYTDVGDDLIMEILNSNKSKDVKNLMLDTYASLVGDRATDGLRQIASSNVDREVVAHAGGLLAKSRDTDGLYEQIVGANDNRCQVHHQLHENSDRQGYPQTPKAV